MQTTHFDNILLFGQHPQKSAAIQATMLQIIKILSKNGVNSYLDSASASYFTTPPCEVLSEQGFNHIDLMIVVGGDGNMLEASKLAVPHNIPVVGVNLGRLGFLTDIKPDTLEQTISDILVKKYFMEERFLLEASFFDADHTPTHQAIISLNDVVLMPNELSANMIQFTIAINGDNVCAQRADGLIIATPTGSTAYSLSGGGPILYPKLDAISLLPMFPHTLSSRPLVVPGNASIVITLTPENNESARVSCDGQRRIVIAPNHYLKINKHKDKLTILHPLTYNYYTTLREKLSWK